MRSTLALSAISAAAVASVSAQNCNPSYNVAPSTDCFTNCNVQAGQAFVSGWTMDSSSPLFLASLKLMCTKGTSDYTTFMTKAGTCMAGCAGDDPNLFVAEFNGACAWYAQHSGDTCASDTTTTTKTTTTTTAAADTTTAATTATTVTTTIAVTTGAATGITSAAASVATAINTAIPIANVSASANVSSAVTPIASGINPITTQPASAATKLQVGAYALALIAGAGYLAL